MTGSFLKQEKIKQLLVLFSEIFNSLVANMIIGDNYG
jgi:hypothetical protein